jgi:predicted DNA-binding transcriptional regulator YafY
MTECSDTERFTKAQKMVRLVEWMQRRGGVRMEEIRERLDLDVRTLRRYLADLRDLGIPVMEEGRAEDRVINMDSSYRRSGVQLTLGEMISLRFGRTLFTFLEGTGFASDIDLAIDRLGPTVSRANAEVVQNFDQMFIAVPEPAKGYAESAEIQDEILSALLYQNPVDACYRRARGVPKDYVLEPYTIAIYRQGLYLFARDVEEDRVKTFAIERFHAFARRRKEKFERPSSWDPRVFVGDAFGITIGPAQKVVVRFSPEVAEFIRERRWHRSQAFTDEPDGGVRMTIRCAITPELRQWILGFGADARVVEPDVLRDEIRETLRCAASLYDGDGPGRVGGTPA